MKDNNRKLRKSLLLIMKLVQIDKTKIDNLMKLEIYILSINKIPHKQQEASLCQDKSSMIASRSVGTSRITLDLIKRCNM